MPTGGAPFSIRPFRDHELEAWLHLRNQSFPWPVSRERFLFDESLRAPGEPVLYLGAWTPDGALAGTAESYIGEEGERYIDRAEGFVMVAPEYRRRGLGARLADAVERFAREQEVRWLEVPCYETNLDGARPLFERRGFRVVERYQESWQEPQKVSLAGLKAFQDRLRGQGIETGRFSQFDSPRMRRALYRCAMEIEHDMPHEPTAAWNDAPFETWIKKVLDRPGASADTIFVARDGDRIVGLTYFVLRGDGDAEVGDTGVVDTHRRRGIARVLKMLAAREAAQRAIRRVQTDNRSDNAGMLAINRDLGFEPGQLILIFEKAFDSAGGA